MSESIGGEVLAPPRRSRSWLRRATVWALMAGLLYLVARALAAGFGEIDWTSVRVSWGWAVAGLTLLVAGRWLNAAVCDLLLVSLGCRIGHARAVAIVWASALGRYVPGKFASGAGALVLLGRAGVGMAAGASALLLSVGLGIVVSVIVAAPLLLAPSARQNLPWVWLPAGALVACGCVALHPRVFTWAANLALRRLGRAMLPARPDARAYIAGVGLTALRVGIVGTALWCSARAILPAGLDVLGTVVSGWALASTAGFLAVFAPAGIGVQEGGLLLALRGTLGPQVALLVVAFRLLQTLTDALTGLAGLWMLGRGSRAKA